jgi:hypothetical protein
MITRLYCIFVATIISKSEPESNQSATCYRTTRKTKERKFKYLKPQATSTLLRLDEGDYFMDSASSLDHDITRYNIMLVSAPVQRKMEPTNDTVYHARELWLQLQGGVARHLEDPEVTAERMIYHERPFLCIICLAKL